MSNELYYRGSSTYETTVTNQLNQLRDSNISLRNSMRNMEYGIRSDIRASTYAIVASQQMLAETFHDGFNSVNNTLEAGFEMFSSRLANLESSITEIGEKICNKLDEIHDIVNNPLLTQSRELYRLALTNYNKGYFEEALSDCKAAVEKNKTDYISWNLLGQIFLFGAGKFSNVINLEYAEKSFTNAAKYIDADLGKSDEANQLGSEIYYYLGYTKLLLSNDYLVENKIDDSNQKLAEAENHSKQAYQLYNENILAAYEQAKELHFLEKDDESLAILEEIFKKEPIFAVKASNDKNFESIWSKIDNLIKKLNDEITKEIYEKSTSIYKSCEQQIDSLKQEVQKLNIPSKEVFEPMLPDIEPALQTMHKIIKNKISDKDSKIGFKRQLQRMTAKLNNDDEDIRRMHEEKIESLESEIKMAEVEKEEINKESVLLENLINNPYCPTNELFNEKCDGVKKNLKTTLAKFDVSENTDYLSARKMHNEIDSKSVQEWVNSIINPLKDTLKEFEKLIEATEYIKESFKLEKENLKLEKEESTSKKIKIVAFVALITELISMNTPAWPLSMITAIVLTICLFLLRRKDELTGKSSIVLGIGSLLGSLAMPYLYHHYVIGIINAIGTVLFCNREEKGTKIASIAICVCYAAYIIEYFTLGNWIMGIVQLILAGAAVIMTLTH